MLTYIIIVSSVILTTYLFPRNNKVAIFWMLVLCFMSMFRAESVGTDTSTYMDIMHMYKSYEYFESYEILGRGSEILFSYMYFLIYTNSLSPRFIIMFMSLVTFFFLYLSLKRMKLPYSIGVLVFLILFYFSSMNIARQICACSIVLYAYTFLFETTKKKYLFFVFVFFASTIHSSSIISIAVYLIKFIKQVSFNKRTLSIAVILLFIFNALTPINFSELIISKFSSSLYAELYSDRAITSSRTIMGLMQDILKFSALLAIFNYGNKEKEVTSLDLLFYISIVFTVFSSNAHSDFSRIFLPITFFRILYIGDKYRTCRYFIKSPQFLTWLSVNTFFTIWTISTGALDVVPYKISFVF